MMHPHNMHHQGVGGHPGHPGHPGQHLNHHGLPGHHQMPPHQMHRDQNRLLTGPLPGGGNNSMGIGPGPGGNMAHCPPPRPVHHNLLSGHPQRHNPPPPSLQPHRQPTPHPSHRSAHPALVAHQPAMRCSLQLHRTLQSHRPPLRAACAIPTMPLRLVHPSGHLAPPRIQRPGVLVSMGQPSVPVADTKAVAEPVQLPTVTAVVHAAAQLSPQEKVIHTDIILPDILADTSGGSANNKEKTPMCLVNELARFNKIKHQYRLTSEQGPAHRKRFTVALRLGGGDGVSAGEPDSPLSLVTEEYSAEGSRIRAAQHAVAAEALRRTAFPRPPPRPPRALRNRRPNANGTIMPTVELNALAMKLGEPAVYVLEPAADAENVHNGVPFAVSSRPQAGRPGPPSAVQLQSFNRNSRYYNQNNRFVNNFNKFPNNWFKEQSAFSGMYRVRLTVGSRLFWGEGATPQAARHDAAARALRQFRLTKDQDSCNINEGTADEDDDSEEKESCDLKSPVSMVHEIALKFNLPVTFEFKSEKGPPHMKVFVTVCSVAEHVTEGEGNSKKISKKRAAEKMLEELKKLPSVKKTVSQPDVRKPKKKQPQPKKRARNLIKEKADSNGATETNPVSRLLQWSVEASGAGREPIYTLMEESGRGQRRKGFVILCEVAGRKATGSGASKRLAKRSAAENMLNSIDELIEKSTDAIKNSGRASDEDLSPHSGKQDSSPSPPTGGSSGRQLVPGLLLMQDHVSTSSERFKTPTKNGVNVETTATIAKELLRAGTSPTAEALVKHESNHRTGSAAAKAKPISSSAISSTGSPQTSQVIRPKDQLLYLAQLLGFQVQFSDFPKGNHGEFLSLVSLSIDPPMVCHGGGLTTDQSHDQSARAALEHLSRMGLDNVTPHPPSNSAPVAVAQGQGIHSVPTNAGGVAGILTNGITK